MKDSGFAGPAFLGLLVLGAWAHGGPEWGDSRTVYFAVCQEMSGQRCTTKWATGTRLTYIASRSMQTVIEVPRIGSLRRLERCTVADAENWACESGGMRDGLLERSSPPETGWYTKQVPRYQWLFIATEEAFK